MQMGNAQRKRITQPGGARQTASKRQQVLFEDVLSKQSSRGGLPFTRADYVSILIRLDPAYNNALISVYTIDSLRAEIRNVVYAGPKAEDPNPKPSMEIEVVD